MAVDVIGQNIGVTWRRIRMSCVTHVINENKHPFQDFCYLINDTVLIYLSNRSNFCHVGLFSFIILHM